MLAAVVVVIVALYVWIRQPVDLREPEVLGGGQSGDESLVYFDSKTNLFWTSEDNGRDNNWFEADEYCRNLTLVGYTGWRLPTIEELGQLYDPVRGRKFYNIREPFRLSSWWVWSSTRVEGSVSAWYFFFTFGKRGTFRMVNSYSYRALCVRRSGE